MRILACAQDGEASFQDWGPYVFGMDFLGGEFSISTTTSSCLDLNHDQNKDNGLTFMLVARIRTFSFFSFHFLKILFPKCNQSSTF